MGGPSQNSLNDGRNCLVGLHGHNSHNIFSSALTSSEPQAFCGCHLSKLGASVDAHCKQVSQRFEPRLCHKTTVSAQPSDASLQDKGMCRNTNGVLVRPFHEMKEHHDFDTALQGMRLPSSSRLLGNQDRWFAQEGVAEATLCSEVLVDMLTILSR